MYVGRPTQAPTPLPTVAPTSPPSTRVPPSAPTLPTAAPTTVAPTRAPTVPTSVPTSAPTLPTRAPTVATAEPTPTPTPTPLPTESGDSDTRLAAYWDNGECGPHGDNHNWEWCDRWSFNCSEAVTVSTEICASGRAGLVHKQRFVRVGACTYAYYAQYACMRPDTQLAAYWDYGNCGPHGDNSKGMVWYLEVRVPADSGSFNGSLPER